MQSEESALNRVCNMSVYDPGRKKAVVELMQDKHLFGEDPRFQKLEIEAEGTDLSPIFIHRAAYGRTDTGGCAFEKILELRSQLCRFYADLRKSKCYELQEIVGHALEAEEGSSDFWKWHAYLEIYIANNKIDTKEMMEVCKKCLQAESRFCHSLGTLHISLDEISAFSKKDSESKMMFGVETLKLHFLGIDAKTAPSKVPEEIMFANRFLYPFSTEEIFALWHRDAEVVQAVGLSAIKKCIQEISDYFCDVSDEDLCFDYLNVSLNTVLNQAAEGMIMQEIEEQLRQTEQKLSKFTNYRREIKAGIAITLKACRQFPDFRKEEVDEKGDIGRKD